MLSRKVSYLPIRKAYELGIHYRPTDGARRHVLIYRQAPGPPRLKVKVARSRGASDRCWSIRREQNVSETPKLVVKAIRLPTSRAIMRTSFKVKRSKAYQLQVGSITIFLKLAC